MIDPIKVISAKTTMSNPMGFGANEAYQKALNNPMIAQKLDVNTNLSRPVCSQGKKLDILA